MARRARGYIIQPRLGVGRVKDMVYKRVKIQTSKWKPVSISSEGLCSNVRPTWVLKDKKFEFMGDALYAGDFGKNREKWADMYSVMSSALLLYRLLCLFKCDVVSEGPKGYKCVWWITLQHRLTGELLMFGEWKGAAGIWTRFGRDTDMPGEYKDDVLLLLNEVYAKDCPHPYDGCVAGSVA